MYYQIICLGDINTDNWFYVLILNRDSKNQTYLQGFISGHICLNIVWPVRKRDFYQKAFSSPLKDEIVFFHLIFLTEIGKKGHESS